MSPQTKVMLADVFWVLFVVGTIFLAIVWPFPCPECW
jgi:hypothetical protein